MKKHTKSIPEESGNQDEKPEVYTIQRDQGKIKFSRRDFLKASGAFAAGSVLAGCAKPPNVQHAPTTPTKPLTKVSTVVPTKTPVPTPTSPPPSWNCEGGKAHDSSITNFEYTADGRYLISRSSEENVVKIWSFPDGSELRFLTGHGFNITSMVISPDGRILISGDEGGEIKLWSLPDGVEENSWNAQANARLYITPDGQILVSRDRSAGSYDLWSIPDGTLLNTLEHTSVNRAFCWFSPDSQVMLSIAFQEDTMMFWSLPDGELIKTVDYDNIVIPKFSPDGRFVFVGNEQAIEIWSLPDGNVVNRLEHLAKVSDVVVSSDGNTLITGDEEGTIKVWSLPGGKEQNSWLIDSISYFTLSKNDQVLVVDNGIETITIWKLPDGVLLNSIEYPSDTFPWTEISPDNSILAFLKEEENVIELYSLLDGSLLNALIFADKISSFRFSPDSKFLVTGDEGGAIKLWSMPDGKESACMVDIAASSPEIEGVEYSVEVEGQTVTYTLPCGAPIPPGAVCVCNCVAGTGCACVGYSSCSCVGDTCSCVGHTCSCVGYTAPGGCSVVYHYWHPN